VPAKTPTAVQIERCVFIVLLELGLLLSPGWNRASHLPDDSQILHTKLRTGQKDSHRLVAAVIFRLAVEAIPVGIAIVSFSILGVSGALLAILGLLAVYGWTEDRSPPAKSALAFLLGLAAIPGICMGLHALDWIPDWKWFLELRSHPRSDLLVVPVGLAAGAFAGLAPAAMRSVFLLAAGACVTVPSAGPLIAPLPFEEMRDRWLEDASEVCLASTTATSGPASACTVMNQLGVRVTEKELARASYSHRGGTEVWYLARALNERGFAVEFVQQDEIGPGLHWPVIAEVRRDGRDQSIAVLGREGEAYVIGDPLEGSSWKSLQELRDDFRFTGLFLEVRRDD